MEKLIRLLKESRRPKEGSREQAIKDYTDDVQSFFVAAYHIKDHVRREDQKWYAEGYNQARARAESEALFHGKDVNWARAFTHDLCNSIKHGELTSPKWEHHRLTGVRGLVAATEGGRWGTGTVYDTPTDMHFADDVMQEVLADWLAFIDKAYMPQTAAPFRRLLGQVPPPREEHQKLKLEAIRARALGEQPEKLSLMDEMPVEAEDRAAYWEALPLLPIPDVDPKDPRGEVFHVEALEVLPVPQEIGKRLGFDHDPCTLPTLRVLDHGGLTRVRLPPEYSDITTGAIGIAQTLGNPFPCDVEFGRIPGGPQFGGYYMELL